MICLSQLKVLKVSMLADRRGLDDYANAVVTSFTRVPSMSHLPPLPGDRPAVGATPRSDAKMEPSLGGGLGATVSVRTAGPAGSSGGGQVMTVSLTKFLDPVATSAGADTGMTLHGCLGAMHGVCSQLELCVRVICAQLPSRSARAS